MSLRKTRLLKELALLENFSHEGIKFIAQENLETLEFELIGPEGTPFANETLQLEMKLTNRYIHGNKVILLSTLHRYPLEPPILRFTTPVRHPNIDEVSGRICLDLFRMPPEGSWRPNVSLGSVLVSVHALLGAPNLDDPVRPDLISEWQDESENIKLTSDENLTNNMTIDENENVTNDMTANKPTGKRTFSLSLSEIRKKSKTEELTK